MTKNEEIQAWESFASSLPDDSYTKGAVYPLLIEIENAIRSDIRPELSIHNTRALCASMKKDAEENAASLLRQAQKQAEEITKQAETKAENIYRKLYEIQGAINRALC